MAPAHHVKLLQSLADSTSIALENVAILQDLDRRIQDRTRELEAANTDLAAFNAAVSHDLRNPIAVIMGFSGLIAECEGSQLSPQAKEWLGRIQAASKSMVALTEDLMRLSAASDQELTPTHVDVSSLAEAAVAALRQADPAREVGRVDAEAGPSFFVRDNGVGFDMAQAGRLFQPFSRLVSGKDFQGTGIGLVTVKRIVERHGGRIWAEGRPDEGATVFVET